MTAPRIRLRMEGQPQEAAEAAALILVAALEFCAKPESFPVFMAFTRSEYAGDDWVTGALGKLEPDILLGVKAQLAAGVVADFEAAQ